MVAKGLLMNNTYSNDAEGMLTKFIDLMAREKQGKALVLTRSLGATRYVFDRLRTHAYHQGYMVNLAKRCFIKGDVRVLFHVLNRGAAVDLSGMQFSHIFSTGYGDMAEEEIPLRARLRAPSCEEYTLPIGWYLPEDLEGYSVPPLQISNVGTKPWDD